jgi:restriction system protein
VGHIQTVVALAGSGMSLAHGKLTVGPEPDSPSITLHTVLTFANANEDGRLVESVAVAWFAILARIAKNRDEAYRLPPHVWEEIIAGAYKEQGFDEVILTPRSGDLGRDVIASRTGVGSIRIYDQVKAYKPGHVVPANDVRALAGILQGNVSKGVITTTSDFAPLIHEDRILAPLMPHRLELKPGRVLFPWLESIAQRKPAV